MQSQDPAPGGERSASWRNVDQSGASDDMAAYLERAARAMSAPRAESLAELRLAEDDRVLDAGCGTGVAAFEMAELVGPGGVVHAMDASEDMVESVRGRSSGTVVQPEVGDIRDLRLPDDACSAARTERVLIHLTTTELEAAVAELVRVVHPGGRIVLLETCHNQSRIDDDDLLVPAVAGSVANGSAGLQLRGALLRAGCTEVTSVVRPLVFTSIEELHPVMRLEILAAAAKRSGIDEQLVEAGLEELRTRDRNGTFFAVVVFYLAAATVP